MLVAPEAFTRALLDPNLPVPAGLTAQAPQEIARRFAIYRNNVVTSLIDALFARFPASAKITGEDFFAAMARVYLSQSPPTSPLMFTFGESFPDFAAAFPPAAEMPYLADVMRIEAARTRAYHAADAAPLDPPELAAQLSDKQAQDVALLGFALHPSIAVIASPHPVVTIWAMNAGEMPLDAIDNWQAETALVVRPQSDVHVVNLPSGSAEFIIALRANARLGDAAAHALSASADFDLTSTLAALISAQAFTSLHPEKFS